MFDSLKNGQASNTEKANSEPIKPTEFSEVTRPNPDDPRVKSIGEVANGLKEDLTKLILNFKK